MSIASLPDTDALSGKSLRPGVVRLLLRPLRRIAFWSAIVLPFLHVSLLVSGIESGSMALAFVALLALNAVAIYVGHPSRRE